MSKCKYNDCGWCYAPSPEVLPENIRPNDDNGQCNRPDDCSLSDANLSARIVRLIRVINLRGESNEE